MIIYIYDHICIFIWYTPCFDDGAYVCFYWFSQAVAFGVCCPHPGRMNFSTVMSSPTPKMSQEKTLDCSLVGGLFPLPPVHTSTIFSKKDIYFSLSQLVDFHASLIVDDHRNWRKLAGSRGPVILGDDRRVWSTQHGIPQSSPWVY